MKNKTTLTYLRFLLFVGITLMFAHGAFAQTGAKDDAALKALVSRMTEAQMAFDVKTLDAILTDDYIEVSPLGEVDPREKVLGFYAPEMKPPDGKMPGSVELGEYSIRVMGKTAIVIVKETYTPKASGTASPLSRSIRVMLVCRREKDTWKIASAQYTGIRPAQAAAGPK